MYSKLLTSFLVITSIITYSNCEFEPQKDIFEALADNKGVFDFGFTFTYVGELPFELEYYLFIGQHFWRIHTIRDNEREVCVDEFLSDQHTDFKRKYSLAFSYLSDHMVKHSDELNLTNHLFLQHDEKSYLHEYEGTHEINEWIFDANHDNLDYVLGASFYVFTVPGFYPSVAFQPQSFLDNEDTNGPNFVFIEQNLTVFGYERRVEIHSVIDETVIRNRTEEYGQYIPQFINELDKNLFINVILRSRLGTEDTEKGRPAVILILLHEGVIKYCITEEKPLDQSCKPSNLKQLTPCPFERDEL